MNGTNSVQIGRLVKNEPDIELAIADEVQNFKEHGVPHLVRSTSEFPFFSAGGGFLFGAVAILQQLLLFLQHRRVGLKSQD